MSKVYGHVVVCDFGLPLAIALVPTHTLEAGSIGTPLASVFLVMLICRRAKVVYAVVGLVPILMVQQAMRKLTKQVKICEAMGFVDLAINLDNYITLVVEASGDVPDMRSPGCFNIPRKLARIGVVVQ